MRLDATWAVMWLVFQWAGVSKVGVSGLLHIEAVEFL
jgi:hypothetical protein